MKVRLKKSGRETHTKKAMPQGLRFLIHGPDRTTQPQEPASVKRTALL